MREIFLSGICMAIALFIITPIVRGQDEPIFLEQGPHPLIDDYLIESARNVKRRVNQPRRFLKEPVVKGIEASRNPDGSIKLGSNFNFDVTVWYDPEEDLFKMVHSGWYPDNPYTPVLRESRDGIHWSEVRAVLERIGFDDRENSRYPDRRFKSLTSTFKEGDMSLRIGEVWFSPDGERDWKPYTGNPVFTPEEFPGRGFEGPVPYFNPISALYGVFMHVHNPSYTFRDADGVLHRNAYVRQVWHATSPDFKRWSRPKPLFTPDSGDKGITQFYCMTPIGRRGEYLIAVLRMLRDDLKAKGTPDVVYTDLNGNGLKEPLRVYGIGYTVLAWTRDGVNWHRDRYTDKFFEPDPDPRAWDHAHAWVGSCVPVGDEIYVYYGGYKYGHKVYTDRQIGVAKLKRDRFVAWEAGEVPGVLRTRLVRVDCERLTLNVDADGGEVRVRVLDERGKPIKGFTFEECVPIRTDSLDAPVRWKTRSLRELAGVPIHIEFQLKNAGLFAFTLSGKIGLPTVEFKRTASEGVEAEGSPRFAVVLSGPSERRVTVGYRATGGTAREGADYVLKGGRLKFEPGETLKWIWMDVIYDEMEEGDETVEISLHDPENAKLGDKRKHIYTIHDDGNKPPVIDAGTDRYATFPVKTVQLRGIVADDGLPDPPLKVSVRWKKVSGPGRVSFADRNAPVTTATFERPGVYLLSLTGNDGRKSSNDTVRVIVNEGMPSAQHLPTKGLILWLKADGDLRKGGREEVTTWFDQSGNGHRFYQPSDAKAPLFVPKALNGRSALEFDGRDDELRSRWPQISAGGWINERTIALLFRTGKDVRRRQVIFKQGDRYLGLNVYLQDGRVYIGGFNVRSGWKPTYFSAPVAPKTPYCAVLIYSRFGNRLRGFLNGRELGRKRGVARLWGFGYWASIGGVYGGTLFHDGKERSSGCHFSGHIAEVLYYERELSERERQAVEDYLKGNLKFPWTL